MTQHPLDRLQAVAIEAAKAAGELQLGFYDRPLHVDALHAHDLKLEIDRICEHAILDIIQSEFPGHTILAEEGGTIENGSQYIWIIDPLDGTVNFYNRIPFFCSCIACYYREPGLSFPQIPLLGVVYAPVVDEIFVGIAGGGATCNGRSIQVPFNPKLSEMVIGVSFGSTEPVMQYMERIISRLIRSCHKVRILGSCGLDIANVACGRLGALIQRGVRLWDFAASRIILQEAGGTFEAFEVDGGQWDILACPPEMMNALKKVTHSA
ncbi:MAG: inositol monophosphatase [Deltaproteobacteria bacterium]|nr:inositol monophosphatase [Deltaproteobacteria bacterium]